MATGTQPIFDVSSMLSHLALDPTFHDVIPLRSQSFESSESIQIQIQIRLSAPTVSKTYPESAYQWLVGVLDGLIDFGQRHGHYGIIKLTKDEYQWLDDVLEELICSVGEDESHPLAPLMDFIIRLIANYEQAYVPKLTERFPELAEEDTAEVSASENKPTAADTPKPSDNVLAAHAFFSIAHLLGHTNWSEKKIAAYEKATVLKPDFWEASYNCGIARYNLKQYTEAMVDFNRVVELNHNFASAYHNRGILKSELKDYEGAIADFNEVIKLKPDHIEAFNNRGIAKSKLDQHEAAIADFDSVIRLNPNHADAYYNRGVENNLFGNYRSAIDDFSKVINLNPNDAGAYYKRGHANYRLGNHQDAIDDFDKTIELDPSNFAAHYYRGTARLLLNNSQDTIADFDKAIKLKPDIAEAYYCNVSLKKV